VEDHDIITECLRGRTEAYAELVRKYQDRLYNAVFRYLDSAEDAMDVVQETFLNAYQHLRNFKAESRFFTWIYRIAFNLAVDLHRKRKPTVRLDAVDEDNEPTGRHGIITPLELLTKQEDCERVRNALKKVSPEHRLVLILKDLDDLSYQEMSKILKVPMGTIRSRLHRARAEMRTVWEQMGSLSDSRS
jgi:RNA polymerase sigma-70 factor (ECF subfamily)